MTVVGLLASDVLEGDSKARATRATLVKTPHAMLARASQSLHRLYREKYVARGSKIRALGQGVPSVEITTC